MDSINPRRPTDFTDTTRSVLWADAAANSNSDLWTEPAPLPSEYLTPSPNNSNSDLWAESAPLPSDYLTPFPKILGHRLPLTLDCSPPSPPSLTSSNPHSPNSFNPPKSPNVESLSPIPTIYEMMINSSMIVKIPNPYSVSLTL